ncbi:amino acid/amide ABC transporter membrane protein 1 (HAAT family) [Prosthecobacter fusiformis]|uniref:Amino acid/amide ABC transporter membrane protein 1 (HAAT family) n=1 Tax=Prosthecobacter fusiformis TaxID=48464 RepID=A0A4R7RPG5_9BACT|nr:urea ABC transporter permease subunit UrtB [Prosthecobacter fusiformis]TDU67332.1 amino acid/amide ABC transporter membrane protein 1 (HAAT family) [Prosthecobacter fusiformis]
MNKAWFHGIFVALIFTLGLAHAQETKSARQIIAEAVVLTDDSDAQVALVNSLTGMGDPETEPLLTLWKEGGIYLLPGADGVKIPVTLAGDPDATKKESAVRLDNKEPYKDAAGAVVRVASNTEIAETDSSIRRAMKAVIDLSKLAAPDAKDRLMAISQLGMERDLTKLPILEGRLKLEKDGAVKRAIQEAIALTQLRSPDVAVRLAGCKALEEIHPLSAKDALEGIIKESEKAGDKELLSAAKKALAAVEGHRSTVNFFGTLFRGLSSGSVLLVVAIGLSITFGLMGVINMAHGELIVVGAYTSYVVQCVFAEGLALSPFGIKMTLPGMNTTGWVYEMYFVIALPMAFIMAALVGLALERGVIRFLYRRPLESLLATWGVSLVLQQLFRMIFGSNNVQVNSPAWLSDNWTVNDVVFGWNRVFVIGFAVLIVIGTWLLLTKTPLGLLIRAVMQNRNMAACLGVRTERVNMLTFGFGSGLAGLAGAFLSQIGNVGPNLGQSYIVDAFMTVVVGGVGSLIGTVASALGIGVVDQSLQQILGNPVLGKILVLGAIILFLQWRPAGLFATKTRSLES